MTTLTVNLIALALIALLVGVRMYEIKKNKTSLLGAGLVYADRFVRPVLRHLTQAGVYLEQKFLNIVGHHIPRICKDFLYVILVAVLRITRHFRRKMRGVRTLPSYNKGSVSFFLERVSDGAHRTRR